MLEKAALTPFCARRERRRASEPEGGNLRDVTGGLLDPPPPPLGVVRLSSSRPSTTERLSEQVL